MDPKTFLPRSPDSLLHPDHRAEVDEEDEANRLLSAKAIRERYSNLETRIDEAKGTAEEAKEIAGETLATVKELAADFKSFRKEDAEKDVRILTDMMMLMGSSNRVERRLDVIVPTVEATTLKVGRLDNENESNREKIRESHESIRVVANDVRSTQTRLSEKLAADKLDRARLEERYSALKSDISDLKKDVTESGQHAAIGEAFARKSLDSVNDLGEITKIKVQETVEIKREGREDKRHLWKWALGIVGTLILAFASYEIAHFAGAPPQAPPSTPAGMHP